MYIIVTFAYYINTSLTYLIISNTEKSNEDQNNTTKLLNVTYPESLYSEFINNYTELWLPIFIFFVVWRELNPGPCTC